MSAPAPDAPRLRIPVPDHRWATAWLIVDSTGVTVAALAALAALLIFCTLIGAGL